MVVAVAGWIDDVSSYLGLTPAEFWDVALTAAAGIGGLVVILRFIAERKAARAEQEQARILRREELDWRRTELIAQLFQTFESNDTYQKALLLITRNKHGSSGDLLTRALDPEARDLSEAELASRFVIDRYLDFFDRLYSYIHITKVLGEKELLAFSGYVEEIRDTPVLRKYAESYGYEVVVRLAESFTSSREALLGR